MTAMRRTGSMLLCAILMSGCGLLKRTPNQFYALDTIPPAGPRAAVTGVPIGIDGLELPPGLDRRGIAIREGNGRLEVRGMHQWSAPLEDMVTHTLAFNLANRLPEGMVVLPGQAKPAAMRPVFVVMEELAPGQDGVFVLDARWTIAGVTRHEQISVQLPGMESEQIVAGMNQALAQLADRMVAGL